VTEQYDLLVGADGVGSTVRAALQEFHPDMTVVVSDSGREYKTYRGLTGNIEPPGE
jgi:ubiquitin carboxyl-terminal hydrolase 48